MPGAERAHCNAVEPLLDRHVEQGLARRPALREADRSLTYGELHELVERAAAGLWEIGVRPRDRVVTILPDSIEAVAFLLAAMRIGAAPAPLHTALTDEEYAFVCADCRPTAAIAAPEGAQRLRTIRASLDLPCQIVAVGDGADAGEAGDVLDGGALLASVTRRGLAPTRPDDLALLQYTSGSTGRPKGVVHAHCGVAALPRAFGRHIALVPDDVCFSAAKLFFGYGLGNSVLLPLAVGASSVLHAPRSEPLAVYEAIHAARPTIVFGSPTLYTAMLAIHGAEQAYDLTSVRLYVSAGEALPAAVFERWERRTGHQILDGLGTTECLHVFLAGTPGRLRAGRIGGAVAPYSVRVLDERGRPVRAGEVGHLHVRGPSNCVGYWNRPAATAAAMSDGWVRTGDLVTQDDDGMLRYVGRSDDVFKVRAMKVAPLEVEACLQAHEAVAECAVVPGTGAHGVTVACAYVRLADGWSESAELARALRAVARAALPAHKVPELIRFVDAMPRTSTGKLARHALREALAGSEGR